MAAGGARPLAVAGAGAPVVRRHLAVPELENVLPHDHVAWCGDGPDALDRVAATSFASAVARRERLVLVSDRPEPGPLGGLDARALLAAGTLQCFPVADVYGGTGDPDARWGLLEGLLEEATAAGYGGLCVVADCSVVAEGDEEAFAAWLAWEARVDELLASRPVTGVCFFDRRRLPPARRADLAALHPVRSEALGAPSFQLFVDDGAVRVLGALDVWCADQLERLLASAPSLARWTFDLSEVEFVDHRALRVLNEAARRDGPVRLRGATGIVRRVWDVLGEVAPALEFC